VLVSNLVPVPSRKMIIQPLTSVVAMKCARWPNPHPPLLLVFTDPTSKHILKNERLEIVLMKYHNKKKKIGHCKIHNRFENVLWLFKFRHFARRPWKTPSIYCNLQDPIHVSLVPSLQNEIWAVYPFHENYLNQRSWSIAMYDRSIWHKAYTN